MFLCIKIIGVFGPRKEEWETLSITLCQDQIFNRREQELIYLQPVNINLASTRVTKIHYRSILYFSILILSTPSFDISILLHRFFTSFNLSFPFFLSVDLPPSPSLPLPPSLSPNISISYCSIVKTLFKVTLLHRTLSHTHTHTYLNICIYLCILKLYPSRG